MGGKSNTPTPPPYMDLANQQSAAQSALLSQQTTANRPDTTTPFGTTSWQNNDGIWSGSSTLNPALTSALTAQEGEQQQQLGVGQNLLNANIGAGTFNPVNYQNGPQVEGGNYYTPQASAAIWNQFQGMEQPLLNQQYETQQSQLEAQGLRPGDTAYDNSMRNLGNTQYQQEQAAQDQAVLAGEQEAQTMQGMDVQAQNQYMAMMAGQQNQNMNMLNSVMGTNPNLGSSQIGAASAGVAAPPNLLSAAEQQYQAALNSTNASNAANSNLWQGLGSLAGDAAMAFAMA